MLFGIVPSKSLFVPRGDSIKARFLFKKRKDKDG